MMTWQFTIYAYTYLVTAAISCVVTVFCWQRRAAPAGISLCFLMAAIAEWAGAGALEMAAVGIPAKIFWSQVTYLGNTTAPVFSLIFALDYTRQTKWLTRRNLALLMAMPVLTILMAATNDSHHLLWTAFTPSSVGENILVYGHGPWFWVFVAYSYLALATSIGAFVRSAIVFRGPYRRQAGMLLLASLMPCAGNVLYVLDLSPVPGLDVTPIAFSVTGWMIAVSMRQFRLLDLSPVARDALVEHMGDGVIVVDNQRRLVDINPAARRLLGVPSESIGRRVEAVVRLIPDAEGAAVTQSEIVRGEEIPCHLDVRVVPLRGVRADQTGHLIVVRDVTQHKRLEASWQEMNAKLEESVAERSTALQAMVTVMEGEIAERKHMEDVLRQMEENLSLRVAAQSRNLSALYELIVSAGQSLSVDQIQGQALATIMAVMNADAGCTHRLDETGKTLRLRVQRDLSPAMQAQIETIPCDWMLGEGMTHLVTDLPRDPGVPPSVRLPLFQAYLGIPIYLQATPVGALGIFWTNARSFSVEDIALFSAMGHQLAIVVENARLREQGEAAAVMNERRRLARDLHDSVTQSLHSLVLHSEIASHRLSQGKFEPLGTSLEQLADSARQCLKEMRLLLFEMRLVPLEQVNIAEALQLRLEAVEKRAGVATRFMAQDLATLPKIWEEELYCIAMEALNNSLKHARADAVTLRLQGNSAGALLEVIDNGIGLGPQSSQSGGLGMRSMRERAERIGGELTVTSSPGAGTRICVRVGETQAADPSAFR